MTIRIIYRDIKRPFLKADLYSVIWRRIVSAWNLPGILSISEKEKGYRNTIWQIYRELAGG